jgi:hypothetical protein
MRGFANIGALVVIATTLASMLGGCGYRELKAPCGPDEALPAAAIPNLTSFAPVGTTALTFTPLDQLAVGEQPVLGACGPLRPINGGGAMPADRSPSGNRP